tara:strand:- start:392 stop:565 length:174 start_codon:yes stop_codon:yes gene_type:complete
MSDGRERTLTDIGYAVTMTINPDVIKSKVASLVARGLLASTGEKSGIIFYRKSRVAA